MDFTIKLLLKGLNLLADRADLWLIYWKRSPIVARDDPCAVR